MPTCALCLTPDAHDPVRLSGLDLCAICRASDPAERLIARGVAVEWYAAMMRFNAGLGIPGMEPELYLECVPELLMHKLVKLGFPELQVGDPTFDDAIYVRTNNPELAGQILASDGVQSAILGLLTGVRTNELIRSRVCLQGPTLEVSTRPQDRIGVQRLQELKLETTALALHLLSRTTGEARP